MLLLLLLLESEPVRMALWWLWMALLLFEEVAGESFKDCCNFGQVFSRHGSCHGGESIFCRWKCRVITAIIIVVVAGTAAAGGGSFAGHFGGRTRCLLRMIGIRSTRCHRHNHTLTVANHHTATRTRTVHGRHRSIVIDDNAGWSLLDRDLDRDRIRASNPRCRPHGCIHTISSIFLWTYYLFVRPRCSNRTPWCISFSFSWHRLLEKDEEIVFELVLEEAFYFCEYYYSHGMNKIQACARPCRDLG